jgi:phosphoribosylanthranilate isomerase
MSGFFQSSELNPMPNMPIQAKICGITTPETVDAAIKGGASHIGFVFFPKSLRNVSIDQAAELVARLPASVKAVGLFVDPEPDFIEAVRAKVTLQVLQFHGDERPAFTTLMGRAHGLEIWKAIPVKTAADLKLASKYRGAVHRILYDAKAPSGSDIPGGLGVRFDWSLLNGFAHPLPWILAGGLDPKNVAAAIKETRADFIDVSSGVEVKSGIKDVDKIAAFLKAATLS